MRAQTTLDFAVGMSVFVLAVAFVFAFVPGMLQPFTGGAAETVAVNRVADSLAEGMLGDPANPGTLNRACALAFFDPANNDDPSDNDDWREGCNYEHTSDLPARLGIEGRPEGTAMGVRIRLVRDLTTGEADSPGDDADAVDDGDPDDDREDALCYDRSDDRIVEAGDPRAAGGCRLDDGDVPFAVGGTPPAGVRSIVVAHRLVTVEGGFADGTDDATLVVEVW